MVSENFVRLIDAASVDPNVRGKLIYFPGALITQFELTGAEAAAVEQGDIASLVIEDEQVRRKATAVFDLHDMFAGE
jgi:hypothetical protein